VAVEVNQTRGIGVAIHDISVSAQQGVEREGAALPIVVGVQDDEAVLDGDDEGERPDDNRQSTDEIIPRGLG